ncbi:MAG: class I SAM-dependent methyltransferase [Anaerolineae bacterium]
METTPNVWIRRIGKAGAYIKRGDWKGFKQELLQFLVWKRILSPNVLEPSWPDEIPLLWAYSGISEVDSPFQWNEQYQDFLVFEGRVFGEDFPIFAYDPHLIRYGEYRFVLETLSFLPGETIVDLGCGYNILGLYLAYLGAQILAIDVDPQVQEELQQRKRRVEQVTGRTLAVIFRAEDATELHLEPELVDKVVAISSIEHMFSEKGPGDILAVKGIARILKPGGWAVITLPMSGNGPFHESQSGDEHFGAPYRLYTPDTLEERILSCPGLEKVTVKYLAYTTPDPRYLPAQFINFWRSLSKREREKWAWASALLSSLFNPIISQEEGEKRLETVNTALICLRKIT